MTDNPEPPPSQPEQHPWWEEGCYCPPERCICGTPNDFWLPAAVRANGGT